MIISNCFLLLYLTRWHLIQRKLFDYACIEEKELIIEIACLAYNNQNECKFIAWLFCAAQQKMDQEIKERDEKYAELDSKFGRLHKRAKQRIQDIQKVMVSLNSFLLRFLISGWWHMVYIYATSFWIKLY